MSDGLQCDPFSFPIVMLLGECDKTDDVVMMRVWITGCSRVVLIVVMRCVLIVLLLVSCQSEEFIGGSLRSLFVVGDEMSQSVLCVVAVRCLCLVV